MINDYTVIKFRRHLILNSTKFYTEFKKVHVYRQLRRILFGSFFVCGLNES